MKFPSNTNTDYVYWDDANELVQRLRLLMASERSGHTGHKNEILSIEKEQCDVVLSYKYTVYFVYMNMDKYGKHQSTIKVQK